MADITLPIQIGELPSGACPTDFQSLANLLGSVYSVILAQGTGISVVASSAKPTDTSVLWIQLDSFGRPVRPYYFAQGAWLSQHPLVPGHTMIWTTALPTFTTFDGGDASAASAISGPMWEEVVSLRAKFPIGAGTLPSGTVLAVGATGGEEKHTLVTAETPAHTHFLAADEIITSTSGLNSNDQVARRKNAPGDAEGSYNLAASAVAATLGKSGAYGGDGTGATTAHNNLPNYCTVYFLRRTPRLFYSVP